jgi:hypothetical protein
LIAGSPIVFELIAVPNGADGAVENNSAFLMSADGGLV